MIPLLCGSDGSSAQSAGESVPGLGVGAPSILLVKHEVAYRDSIGDLWECWHPFLRVEDHDCRADRETIEENTEETAIFSQTHGNGSKSSWYVGKRNLHRKDEKS